MSSQNSINNKIGSSTNTNNLEIEKSASGLMTDMFDQTDRFGFYNNAGSPEGVVAADIGSLCTDTANGDLYEKTTDTVNTGWIIQATTSVVGWTPTLEFGGATTGITYGLRLGTLSQSGKTIFFAFNITLISKGSATGSATITGLPGTPTGGASRDMTGLWGSIGLNGRTYISGSIGGGSSTIILNLSGDSIANINLTDVEFANNSNLSITGFYFIL